MGIIDYVNLVYQFENVSPEDLDPMSDDPIKDLQWALAIRSEVYQGDEFEQQGYLQDPGDQCGFRRVLLPPPPHIGRNNMSVDIGNTNKTTKTDMSYRDPDVKAPETKFEWTFYDLHRIQRWLSSHVQFMALKAAIDVVVLAMPVWRTDKAQFYYGQRGGYIFIQSDIAILFIIYEYNYVEWGSVTNDHGSYYDDDRTHFSDIGSKNNITIYYN
ncbi:hypothetical protein BDA99DRAFT_537594 [Phascolomyces articulosus]|uniref:Uncharacterized protein n=1 Tax=Phascolomyces articulosus TaxID=60185 RepID=A0AAD5PDX9_9FUNG|nr:hypothetical protein BDA99DRAFT_537594 [Phascolomyces articulosus]